MSLKVKLLSAGALLLIAGGVGVVYAYFGRASLHLVVPRGRTIELSANGQVLSPTSSAGSRHVTFSLPQGIYDVAVKDKDSGQERKYALELDSGFADYLLPIDERQCFKRVDAARTSQVLDRISARSPIPIDHDDYLDTNELPGSRKKKRRAQLLVDVDCGVMGL